MQSAYPVQCVADVGAVLGEGPVWVVREQALYWVDIKGLKVFRLDSKGGRMSWQTPFRICSLAPRGAGGFIAGTEQGFALVDLDADRFEPLADPEPERPGNRFNDGKLDRRGRFWAGTMDDSEQAASGALYRFDGDRSWRRFDDGYRVTNGPAFSRDGRRMYHNDSALQLTYVFDLDDDGVPSNRRVFARYGAGEGYPDGMTVDSDDCLWIAFWDGWCVRRYSPEGNCLELLSLPVQKPTSCAFGGPNMGQLYVTSASIGLTEQERSEQPCAGGLFMLDTPYTGLEDVAFEG
jgi:xylono-1,5-lactonase